MLGKLFCNVHAAAPRIHAITNYVTANDCANMLLACGASPIMADDPAEAAEITAHCAGLCINLGTLHRHTIPAMLAAGKKANELGNPIVLDPVGVGASALRTQTALQLLSQIKFSAIRGNPSEIRALATGTSTAGGVDAEASDRITEETLSHAVFLAKSCAEKTGAIVAMTGGIDVVADENRAFCIRNGHPMMRSVTGCGCQLSVLSAAFLAANRNDMLEATAAAVCAMGLCGELAFARLEESDGNAAYRNRMIDTMFHLTPDELERGAKFEVR